MNTIGVGEVGKRVEVEVSHDPLIYIVGVVLS
jgi:hypothetical protein